MLGRFPTLFQAAAQRLSIAAPADASDPKLLIFDEPTVGRWMCRFRNRS